MFSNKKNKNIKEDNLTEVKKLKQLIVNADAIVIGAGAGLSTSAGLHYSGERFDKYFSDYANKYGFKDMYSAAFYPHTSLEEFWAYFSKHIYYNRYNQELNSTYADLFKVVKDKNYFVITTNVDHLFQKYGFDKERLFYMQGDYGLLQCSNACHNQTYDNQELIYEMVDKQSDFKIPSALIPYCKQCGQPMTTNLRKDSYFVQDAGWHQAMNRYDDFIKMNNRKKVLFLELGVGFNTPAIIKYPFWQMTYHNKNAYYVSINSGEVLCAKEITKQSLLIKEDIHKILKELLDS